MKIDVKKIDGSIEEYIEIGCHARDGRVNDIVRFVENLDGNISGTKGGKRYSIPVSEIFYIEIQCHCSLDRYCKDSLGVALDACGGRIPFGNIFR